jgi:hypothetical protein
MDTFDFINDPITAAQVQTLASLLGEQWSEKARDGFLITSGRFVDDVGADRTEELGVLYKTHLLTGKVALRRSLEALLDSVGSLVSLKSISLYLSMIPNAGRLESFLSCQFLESKRLPRRYIA